MINLDFSFLFMTEIVYLHELFLSWKYKDYMEGHFEYPESQLYGKFATNQRTRLKIYDWALSYLVIQ